MKKIILLAMATSLIFGDYSSTTFKRTAQEKEYKNKKNNVSFRGKVFNVRAYRDHLEITIETKERKRIQIKVPSTQYNRRFNDNKKISGSCSKYEFGIYTNCHIY